MLKRIKENFINKILEIGFQRLIILKGEKEDQKVKENIFDFFHSYIQFANP